MSDTTGFVTIIISIIVIILFYSRLGSIKDSLNTLVDLEVNKPGNQIQITCEKCKEVYSVSPLKRGELINCPKCKETNRA